MAKRIDLIRSNLEHAERIIQEKMRDPRSIPDGAIIVPMHLLAGKRNTLTPARWQIVHQVRQHGRYDQLSELAGDLERTKYGVSKDVDVLVGLGLLHKHKHGRMIAIEPDHRPIIVE